ncbi:hypothetical protein BN2475_110022 [Paraburkholderia ribeironis]|uniref:Uncharacterized protein n=1 Tax=Paraburkholderia ribeironis TaxID=1247936 RepID=A0A1N7RQ80_9BURK|nr:hypothetical protein BN2475_110022 [Paraburkholderia ribeironis]
MDKDKGLCRRELARGFLSALLTQSLCAVGMDRATVAAPCCLMAIAHEHRITLHRHLQVRR